MKKHLSFAVILLLTLVLTGCGCKHETWNEATCQAPKTCAKCGATEGEITDHRWAEMTCQAPKTCEFCGKTEGDIAAHKWAEATCVLPRICEVCGTKADGKPLGHKWGKDECENPRTCLTCGEPDPDDTYGHKWVEATCLMPKQCEVCGFKEGKAIGHDFQDATCTKPNICRTCGDNNRNALGHNWYELNGEKSLCCYRCSTSINYIGLFTILTDVDNGWNEFVLFLDAERDYASSKWVPDGSNVKVYDCGESDEDTYYVFYDEWGGYVAIDNLSPENALDYPQQGGISPDNKTIEDVIAYFDAECARMAAQNNEDAMLQSYGKKADYYMISYYVPDFWSVYKYDPVTYANFVASCQNLSSSFHQYAAANGFPDYPVRVAIGMDPPEGTDSEFEKLVALEIRNGEIVLNMIDQYAGHY